MTSPLPAQAATTAENKRPDRTDPNRRRESHHRIIRRGLLTRARQKSAIREEERRAKSAFWALVPEESSDRAFCPPAAPSREEWPLRRAPRRQLSTPALSTPLRVDAIGWTLPGDLS